MTKDRVHCIAGDGSEVPTPLLKEIRREKGEREIDIRERGEGTIQADKDIQRERERERETERERDRERERD
uniref:Uncharacterized protein n=1 Tax=Biomphalaria glabrata TaxID=6526 RepID=A0A2C9L193_BIOGL